MSELVEQVGFLSQRADLAAVPQSGTLIWRVLKDQWHPDSNPHGYVSLGVAENRLMHSELARHISKLTKLDNSAFTYGDGPIGSHRIRHALAKFLTKHLKAVVPIDSTHVVVTNGVSHGIEHLSWAFANPGDAYLLGKPYYGAFIPDINLRPNVEVIAVQFGQVDPLGVDAVAKYEEALLEAKERGIAVKAIMLCNPHNPLGRCYSREALLKYLQLCQKYQIHLVSDEIYALSVWENKSDVIENPEHFHSILSFDLTGLIYPSLVHVLWGVSKDFGANGIRLGCIVSQNNPALHRALVSVGIYSFASSITDHVVANILEDDAFVKDYIATNRERLSESYSFVTGFLQKHNIDYAAGGNAAFFVWINLAEVYLAHNPDRRDKGEITQEVMNALLQQKLFLASGIVFGSEVPGVFRIVFSHPREYLQEGLQRMMAAIKTGYQEVKPVIS